MYTADNFKKADEETFTRGIKKPSAKTVTTTFRGRFETDVTLQNKLLLMIK